MSDSPPPPPNDSFPPRPNAGPPQYGAQPYTQPYGQPTGYQPYGQQSYGQQFGPQPYGQQFGQQFGQQPAPTNSGMAIAGMVLSLVGIIPCFWLFQVPGLLGFIFGIVGLQQTKNGAKKGRGMAIAGVVIGVLLVVLCVVIWASVDCSGTSRDFTCA